MRSVWQTAAWVSGMVGAAATGAVVGAFAHSTRAMARRAAAQEEPLGRLPVDRQSTVAADDGVPLVVREVLPAGGAEAEVTVVFVHGFALDSRCWHFQQRDLPGLADPPVRLVLYDQRSHGRSGQSTKSGSTIEQLGRDLDAVLRAVAPTGDVVLVGHSMGGMTIMALADRHPELVRNRVNGVAFVSTACSGMDRMTLGLPGFLGNLAHRVERGLADLLTRYRGDRLPIGRIPANLAIRWLVFGRGPRNADVASVVDQFLRAHPASVGAFQNAISLHDRTAALATLRHTPSVVLAGTADRLCSPRHAQAIAAELEAGHLVLYPDAGHMLPQERAHDVAEHIAALCRFPLVTK